MITMHQPNPTRAWANNICHTAVGFSPTRLPVIAGTIPRGLRGSLYRNGPARLERAGQPIAHWFDGDGAILGIHFSNQGATGVYRYVQTEGLEAEAKAGKFLFWGYGMIPGDSWIERFTKPVKNAANTSVIALPDRLLALWEGGAPHALTLDSLDTIGIDYLGGLKGRGYSAHPKRDPLTGEIFNFGVSPGQDATLHLYRSDLTGTIQQQAAISLSGIPLIHDYVLAGKYLVFCIPPVRLNGLPVLARLKSYSDALEWRPEIGTEILVIDRDSFSVVSRAQAEPWYQWHFANGCELVDGSLSIALVRFENFQTNQNLKEVVSGQIQTPARGTLWHLRLDPRSAKILEMAEVVSRGCEFPTINYQEAGQPWRYTYLAVRHRDKAEDDQELFGAIARFDHQTGKFTETTQGVRLYPSEPIYAPDADCPDRGWILTVVYDGDRDISEVWIYDPERLEASPVCRLGLPEVIPLGFHGTWKPGSSGM
jgi:carotenoid cleavage dioxygenase-like enzyme